MTTAEYGIDPGALYVHDTCRLCGQTNPQGGLSHGKGQTMRTVRRQTVIFGAQCVRTEECERVRLGLAPGLYQETLGL